MVIMKDCIFCKIVRGEIPKEFAYEDETIVAFDDISPAAPVHLLIIPKKHIEDFFEVDDDKVHLAISHGIQKLIEKKGLDKKGYKIVVNGGGAQDVFHLHFHLLGPRKRGLPV
jgi:histidine triad (HIT) family protein